LPLRRTRALANDIAPLKISIGEARGLSSQATSKGATKETRERAERVSVVSGSAEATVVAEEDGPLADHARKTIRRRAPRCRNEEC
jgi:hypothetical protein